MEEVIHRAEAYQEIQNRHFGISRYDFRNLFRILLIMETGSLSADNEILDIKLGSVVNDILSFQYFIIIYQSQTCHFRNHRMFYASGLIIKAYR
jgi:hypothetical protein